VPALITRCKPAVVAIVFCTTAKLPQEAQLPVVGEAKTPAGGPDYLYVGGTGFIASADGYVVTAQHVIQGLPEPIQVMMPAGIFGSVLNTVLLGLGTAVGLRPAPRLACRLPFFENLD
jgi:S1-C subfamily serine protease